MAKKNKSLTQQLKEVNSLYEDEQRTRDEQHQMATKAEKRANDLALEVEDIRAQLEQVSSYLYTSQLACGLVLASSVHRALTPNLFLCSQIQRSLRTCDAEKSEAQERVTELSTSNSSLQSAKRKAEQQLATLQVCTCVHGQVFKQCSSKCVL